MEENYENRFKGLIPFTGLMSIALASLIGFFALICISQGNTITAVILFVSGFVATTISYLITVTGGVPLPGPKKREKLPESPLPGPKSPLPGTKHQGEISGDQSSAMKSQLTSSGPTSGVGLPGPHGVPPPPPKREGRMMAQVRFALFIAIMLIAQIGLFALYYNSQENGINIADLILFIAGIIGTTSSYAAAVSGGVPLPGPKGGDKPVA